MLTQKKQVIDWWVLAGSAILSLLLGMVGFHQLSVDGGGPPLTVFDLLYQSLQLFTLESGNIQGSLPVSLEVARWLAPFTTFFAAIKGVLSLLHSQGKRMLRLKKMKGHAIVSDSGHRGAHIASELLKQDFDVVMIDNNLSDTASSVSASRMIHITGNPLNTDVLQHARIETARYLFAVTDDDAENIGTVHAAHTALNGEQGVEHDGPLDCFAHVSDYRTRALFYTHPLFSESGRAFNAQLFSLYDRGARLLFEQFAPDRYRAICNSEAAPVSTMIFGFSAFTKSLLLQAARTGHYANRKRMSVSIIDERAEQKLAALSLSAPALGRIIDIASHDIPHSGLSEDYLQDLLSRLPDVIYISMDSDIQGLTLARRLAGLPGYQDIPVVVALTQADSLTGLLCEEGLLKQGKLTLFPLLEKAGDIDQIVGGQQDEAAKIIHEMYREDQFAQGETTASNAALAAWEDLPESLKDANRGQADHLPIKFRAIGLSLEDALQSPQTLAFTPEQVHRLADMEHRRWVAQKQLEGWTYTTGTKDVEHKLSPLLLDFDELPETEKRKDERAVVVHSRRLLDNLKLRSTRPHGRGRAPASR